MFCFYCFYFFCFYFCIFIPLVKVRSIVRFPELSRRLNVYGASVAMLIPRLFLMSSSVLPILLLSRIFLSQVLLWLLKCLTSSIFCLCIVRVHYLDDVVGFHLLVLCICSQLILFFLLFSFHSILTLNCHFLCRL